MKKQYQSISRCQHSNEANHSIKYPMQHNFFQLNTFIDHLSKLDPPLNILKSRWIHDRVVENYFTQLHKFIDLNSAIVVIIEFHAYLGDVLDVSDLFAIEMK